MPPPLEPLAQALFDDAADALFLLNGSGCLAANSAALRLSGRRREELLAADVISLFDADPNQLKQAVAAGERRSFPDGYTFRTSAGPIPVSVSVYPADLDNQVILAARDQRESARSASVREETQAALRSVFHASPVAIYAIGLDGTVRIWNPACERVFGWREEEVVGQPLPTVPADQRAEVRELVERVRAGESFTARPSRRMRKDGTPLVVSLSAAPLYGREGQVNGVLSVVDDITERTRVEQSLQTQARVLENMAEGVNVADEAGIIQFTNTAFDRMLGYAAGELCGQHVSVLNDVSPEESRRFVAEVMEQVNRHALWVGEIRNRRKSGPPVLTEARISALEVAGRRLWISVQEDITERKRALNALRAAEAKYHNIFEHAIEGIYQTAPDGRFLTANPMLARIYGYQSAEEMLRDSRAGHYIVPGRREEFIRELLANGSISAFESQIRRKDGVVIWISENARSVRDSSGRVLYFEGTAVDITERKQTEEAMIQQHALLSGLLNSIPDLIALKDIHGAYRGCNAAFERHVGRTEAEIMGKTDLELFPAAVGEHRQKTDRQALAEKHLIRSEEWLEYPNGKRVLVDELKTPFFGPNHQLLGIIVIQRDITERRMLEEQLRQSQKMEAVGKLAGGVAHDFNNLLTVILGNVSLLQTGATDAEATAELLSAIERAGWNAAELVRQLLGFSRQTVLRKQPVGLNQLIQEISSMLRRTIDPRIHLKVQAAGDLWPILGDPSQMNQVLMNLCLNARDAMAEGGDLIVETCNVSARDGRPSHTGTAPAEYVRLRVSDTGVGIPEDVRPRIFEPFFTTKPFGKGTGLGLALVFGIVQQHDGWVECHSEPGKGTRFDVYLPRMAQAASEGQLLCAPALPDGRPVTVLLVDDESMIRELGQTWLQRLGYRVMLAADGKQAIEVFERERERIDLVILDVVMPELSGRDVFRQIRRLDVAMPVLFSSGFSNEPIRPTEEAGVVGFIAKPYQVQDLAKAVRNALEDAGRGRPGDQNGG